MSLSKKYFKTILKKVLTKQNDYVIIYIEKVKEE